MKLVSYNIIVRINVHHQQRKWPFVAVDVGPFPNAFMP